MDLVISGIGLLLVLPVWRYILKRSLLDMHRDKLFDLRDNLRDTFHEQKWDMSSPLYKQLRDLLNGYLRYTDHFQYSEFVFIESGIRKNPELQTTMKAKFEANFSGISAKQMQYVMRIRAEARRVMMRHMILSSFPLAMLTLILFPVVGIYTLVCAVAKGVASTGLSFFHSAVELHGFFSLFVKLVIEKIARWFLVEDLVEEYSYRQSKC